MAEARSRATELDVDHLVDLRREAAGAPFDFVRSDTRTGGLAGRRRGRGSDIRELRPYAEGDDLRHVDAMASARSGQLQVRTFHEDQDRTVLLVADFRPPMLWGTRRRLRSVAAGEALALAGWRAVLAGGKVGLLAVTADHAYHVNPQARDKAMLRIAGALSRAHDQASAFAGHRKARPADALATILERAARLAPSGSTVLIATSLDEPGEDFADVSGSLARRTQLIFFLVRDGIEGDLNVPPLPYLPLGSSPGAAPAWGHLSANTPDHRLDILPEGASVRLIDAAAKRPGDLIQLGQVA